MYRVEYWVIGFFILTLVLHFLFKGCICFRLERELFQDKTWYGPYGLMEFVGIDVNTPNVINFLIYGLLLLWLLFHVNLFIKTILTLLTKFSYMQIFVKNPYNKTHTLEIDETDTIRTLFVLINNW